MATSLINHAVEVDTNDVIIIIVFATQKGKVTIIIANE